ARRFRRAHARRRSRRTRRLRARRSPDRRPASDPPNRCCRGQRHESACDGPWSSSRLSELRRLRMNLGAEAGRLPLSQCRTLLALLADRGCGAFFGAFTTAGTLTNLTHDGARGTTRVQENDTKNFFSPGLVSSAWTIFTKDLRIELRTREIVTTAGFFAALVAILAAVAFYSGVIAEVEVDGHMIGWCGPPLPPKALLRIA